MSTTIEINKKSVREFLESGRKERFIIPEYQRPYAWTDEEVQTLFDDLVDYTRGKNESPYFLGTIVSYNSTAKEQEIIDGQQRITTLCLLLRAIYTKIEKMDHTDERDNFIRKIEPAIWQTDDLTGKADKSRSLLESRVFESEYNAILINILETGSADKSAKDNYSKNYNLCQELIDEYAKKEPLTFYNFINNILNKTIVLPIKADNQDTALTIFSTLNDRGLPLSDADIFKAKIYNNIKAPESRNEFIKKWQEISTFAEYAEESIQKLFYYYMFYLRALENDRKTTTPGLRKYYFSNQFNKLFEPNLMRNLNSILNFWSVVNNHEELAKEPWSSNFEILKLLDLLSSYPNEFWKYPVVNYYLNYRELKDFEDNFLNFLKWFFVNLCSRYILTPTINAVKQNILNLNAEIINNQNPRIEFKTIDKNEIREELKNPHANVVRMLLKLLAYDNKDQKELLPDKWEIEHILPKRWQESYFPNISEEEINNTIEYLGNKIPFEKRLNIIASNGYFTKKKESYKKSNISIVKELSESHLTDWKLEQITERSIRISDRIMDIFDDWVSNSVNSEKDKLTKEELEAIELIKSKGLKDFI
ncbi:MAG: DUF262 domain-containing protein [Bacilli bacterium]|jgi:uncharacterized protein with ParB-like and HNH nuclease domain